MQHLVKRWTSSESYKSNIAEHGVIQGCSDDEIKEIRVAQNVSRLPVLYVEFLKAMGRNCGGLWFESATYPQVLVGQINWKPDYFTIIHDIEGDYFEVMSVQYDDPMIYELRLPESPEADMIPIEVNRLSEWLVDGVETDIEEYNILQRRNN